MKTSTGWRRPAPRWRKWRSSPISCVAASRSKAGGIRDLDTVRALYRLGVRRFGMSAAATQRVLEQLEQDPGLFPELNDN